MAEKISFKYKCEECNGSGLARSGFRIPGLYATKPAQTPCTACGGTGLRDGLKALAMRMEVRPGYGAGLP